MGFQVVSGKRLLTCQWKDLEISIRLERENPDSLVVNLPFDEYAHAVMQMPGIHIRFPQLKIHFPQFMGFSFIKEHIFAGNIRLERENPASLVVNLPFDESVHAFYYNHKINCMTAEGYSSKSTFPNLWDFPL